MEVEASASNILTLQHNEHKQYRDCEHEQKLGKHIEHTQTQGESDQC